MNCQTFAMIVYLTGHRLNKRKVFTVQGDARLFFSAIKENINGEYAPPHYLPS